MNESKIILDLCGGTGSWSKPYVEAGYKVILVTLPFADVRTYIPSKNVYGILAAPPYTDFSVSGAQYWKAKDMDGRTVESLEIVNACMKIIEDSSSVFWCLENPVGRLKNWIGEYQHIFNPCDYGDPYTKKTCLWGKFNIPVKNPIEPVFMYDKNGRRYSKIHWSTGGKSAKTKEKRSITPPGFARAFFLANQ